MVLPAAEASSCQRNGAAQSHAGNPFVGGAQIVPGYPPSLGARRGAGTWCEISRVSCGSTRDGASAMSVLGVRTAILAAMRLEAGLAILLALVPTGAARAQVETALRYATKGTWRQYDRCWPMAPRWSHATAWATRLRC